MRKILVPIDFSETSENAFVYALEMAKVYKSQLLLLHTFDLPFVDNQVVVFNYAEIYDTLEMTNSNQFEEELSKLTDLAKKHDGSQVVINHIMMSGDLVQNIKEVVKLENVDFVVMGTKGASGWLNSFIGTTTTDVISDVSVPVLSVSHEAEFNKIDTIGFTTLYREEDMYALNGILAMAKKMEAKVKCLYVKTSDSDFKGREINFWENHYKDEENLEFFIIPSDDVEATIEEFIENQSIDFLAMVTHKKSFFAQYFTSSTTQMMSQHSKTPILALHE